MLFTEPRPRHEGLDQGLLQQVLGELVLMHDEVGSAEQRGGTGFHEVCERGDIVTVSHPALSPLGEHLSVGALPITRPRDPKGLGGGHPGPNVSRVDYGRGWTR